MRTVKESVDKNAASIRGNGPDALLRRMTGVESKVQQLSDQWSSASNRLWALLVAVGAETLLLLKEVLGQ